MSTDFFGDPFDLLARESAARAEPQAIRTGRRDLETAADEGDDEAVGKWT